MKTCEPVAEMRECRIPRDWSLLALQNVRTGKSHYLVICRCPDANILGKKHEEEAIFFFFNFEPNILDNILVKQHVDYIHWNISKMITCDVITNYILHDFIILIRNLIYVCV